jgi:hypothetical protein
VITGAVVSINAAVIDFLSSSASRGISPRWTPPWRIVIILASLVLPLPGFVAVITPIWYGPGSSGRSAGVDARPIQVARSSSLTKGNSLTGVWISSTADLI